MYLAVFANSGNNYQHQRLKASYVGQNTLDSTNAGKTVHLKGNALRSLNNLNSNRDTIVIIVITIGVKQSVVALLTMLLQFVTINMLFDHWNCLNGINIHLTPAKKVL
jgi:hypothetical protein